MLVVTSVTTSIFKKSNGNLYSNKSVQSHSRTVEAGLDPKGPGVFFTASVDGAKNTNNNVKNKLISICFDSKLVI